MLDNYLPDEARAFYPQHVIHLRAARERLQHREMLQREAERLERAVLHHQAEAQRLAAERSRVLAKLAGQAP
jgi:hypothetical protein